jgi:hypothetical protein
MRTRRYTYDYQENEQDRNKTESKQKKAVNTENERIGFYICLSIVIAGSSPGNDGPRGMRQRVSIQRLILELLQGHVG